MQELCLNLPEWAGPLVAIAGVIAGSSFVANFVKNPEDTEGVWHIIAKVVNWLSLNLNVKNKPGD